MGESGKIRTSLARKAPLPPLRRSTFPDGEVRVSVGGAPSAKGRLRMNSERSSVYERQRVSL